jgi:hypothetical protein
MWVLSGRSALLSHPDVLVAVAGVIALLWLGVMMYLVLRGAASTGAISHGIIDLAAPRIHAIGTIKDEAYQLTRRAGSEVVATAAAFARAWSRAKPHALLTGALLPLLDLGTAIAVLVPATAWLHASGLASAGTVFGFGLLALTLVFLLRRGCVVLGSLIVTLWELSWPWRLRFTRKTVRTWVTGLGGAPPGAGAYEVSVRLRGASYRRLRWRRRWSGAPAW